MDNIACYVVGLQMGWLLSGSIIVESVFGWPGIGNRAFKSLLAFDYPVVLGFAIWAFAAYGISNLMTDLLYTVLDPRIRSRNP